MSLDEKPRGVCRNNEAGDAYDLHCYELADAAVHRLDDHEWRTEHEDQQSAKNECMAQGIS